MKGKFYNQKWFAIVTLIFFAPIGIFLIWKNNFFGKKLRIGLSIVVGFIFIIAITSNKADNPKTVNRYVSHVRSETINPTHTINPTPKPTLTKDEIEKIKKEKETQNYQNWIKGQFSIWNGEHTELVRLLKQYLNDADSFEHVKTTYIDQGYGLLIHMTYRAKNAFGGKILKNITAKSDYKTNTIKIIDENN